MQGTSQNGPLWEELGILVAGAAIPIGVIYYIGASPRLFLPLEVFFIWISAYPALKRLKPKDTAGFGFWPYLIKGFAISLLFLAAIELTRLVFPN